MSRSVPRHVTAQELFADEPDQDAIHIASNMITYYLVINNYIRFNYFMGSRRYHFLYNIIFLTASRKYRRHDRKIRRRVQFASRERFDASVKDMFLSIYDQYFNEDNSRQPHLWICIFAMNISAYIHIHDEPSWCMRKIAMLLARVIGGERFRRDIIFENLELVATDLCSFHVCRISHETEIESLIRRRGGLFRI